MALLTLAQQVAEGDDSFFVHWGPLIGLSVMWLFVWGSIAAFLARNLSKLPACEKNVRPWVAYMMLIPAFNIGFNFIVLLGTSNAYIRSFESVGRDLPARETGRMEGLIYSLLFPLGWYPMEATLLGLLWAVGLGALTIYLFKIHSLAQRFARIQGSA